MKSIFKSTIRNFVRKPVINLINLTGLSISIALVIILSLYTYSELTTDNFHKNGDRVYLFAQMGEKMYMPAVLKDEIDTKIPEVESTVRLAGAWEAPVFQAEGREAIASDIVFADADFFKLFTYRAIEGNLSTALQQPMSVVLTKELAGKIFGNTQVIGKQVKLNNNKELTVTAVIDQPEGNSSLAFKALTSIETRKIVQPNGEEFTNWGWCNFQFFILLKSNVNADKTAQKIINLIPKDEEGGQVNYSRVKLNPFKDIYFSQFSLYDNNYLRCGDKKKVMLLALVAALVLIIALVNFINISSSQWLEKIKQTGVLKIIGAGKISILKNILFDAFILFIVSFLLANLLVNSVLPPLRDYTGISFNSGIVHNPLFLTISLAGTLIVCLIVSIIPAYNISSSKAVDNLKKSVVPSFRNQMFRSALVIGQFIITIVLIAFTVLVQKQVNYGSNNLGFNQENIIGIKLTPQLYEKRDVLKQMLRENPIITKLSFTQYYPGKALSHWTTTQALTSEKKQFNFDIFSADPSFFEITKLKLLQGRFYSEDFATEENKMVVNETFAKEHKLDNPVGTKLMVGFDQNAKAAEIIGVVKDFHYKSFDQPIGSLVIQNQTYASHCLVSLNTKDFKQLQATIGEIKKAVSELSPAFPVEISFFDQAVEKMYQSELQFRRTFTLFSICAIVICCMGILAMSIFASQKRTKEIGIRKVNGAGNAEVLTMLNRDFVKWVAIAFVIACPIAWYAMHKWLQSFAYKTELSWWVFAAAGAIALFIALITVSWQSWRAATRNPVESLRYE
jgi:putative ABC transport system permease protein